LREFNKKIAENGNIYVTQSTKIEKYKCVKVCKYLKKNGFPPKSKFCFYSMASGLTIVHWIKI